MEPLVFSEILNGCWKVCQLEDKYYSIFNVKRPGKDDSYLLTHGKGSWSDIDDGPLQPHDKIPCGGSVIDSYKSWDEAITAANDYHSIYSR